MTGAKLDGIALPIDSGAAWTFRPGTAPHMQRIRLPAGVADRLFANSRPDSSRLDISDSNGKTARIEKLTILGTDSSDDPNHSELIIADRRWTWHYPSMYIGINVPRRSGDRRRLASTLPPTAQTIADDITYAEWSLNPATGRAWTTEEVLRRVLDEVAGVGGWYSRGVLEQAASFTPIQDLVLEDHHDAVLGAVLAELGLAVTVFVDAAGRVVLYDRLDDGERDLVGAPPRGITTRVTERKPLIVGGGAWQVQDRRRERPSVYRIMFERLIEIRADAIGGTTVSTASVDPDAPPMTLENVLPSPEDFEIGGVQYVAGEIVSFTVYLNYLTGKQPAGLPRVSEDVIRRSMPHGSLSAWALEELDPSGLWQRRIDAIETHWRLTWRAPKIWMDRIKTVEAKLASIQSAELGQRGESPVFVDYAAHITWRSLGVSVNDRPDVDEVVRNRYANPTARSGGSIVGTPITSLRRAAKCRLNVLDEELGIFGLEFGQGDDFSARVKRVERSAFEPQFIPSDKTWQRNIWLQDGFYTAAYEMSFVATITLGSPADKSRYYAVDISSREAQAALPKLRAEPFAAEGPTLDIIVSPGEAMARHEWDDARAQDVYQLFSSAVPTPANVLGDPLNADFLRAVAISKAAARASGFADHVEGSATIALDPALELRGSAESVTIAADPSKGMISRIELPGEPAQISARALQPKSIQKITRRLVDPKN